MVLTPTLRVYRILFQLDFLMFRGGSGGEFISSLLYKYSNIYRSEDLVASYNKDNKTSIQYLPFFSEITNLPQQTYSIDQLVNSVTEQNITEAEEFLNSHKRVIVRTHYTNSPVLIPRTYFLLLDDERWFDYAGLLCAYKNKNSIETMETIFEYQSNKFNKPFDNREEAIEKITNYMQRNGLDTLSSLKLQTIHAGVDIDESLNSTVEDLYFKYRFLIHGDFETYRNTMQKTPFKKIINFSDIFTKGYLEDIFSVSDAQFHEELMGWHERNLCLLRDNGIDATRYQA